MDRLIQTSPVEARASTAGGPPPGPAPSLWTIATSLCSDAACDVRRHRQLHASQENGALPSLVGTLVSRGLLPVLVHRFGYAVETFYHGRRRRPLRLLLRLVYHIAFQLVSLYAKTQIEDDTNLGPGLVLSDNGGIILGATKVGANCTIQDCVTIGRGPASYGRPMLGSNVRVGAHSVIYGDITIGNGACIREGTVVSRSAPDGAVVEGNPGRIISAPSEGRPELLSSLPIVGALIVLAAL